MAEAVWNEELGEEAQVTVNGWAEEDGEAVESLLERAQQLADELAGRPNLGLQAAPLREVERLGEIGLLTAPLPREHGGLGLGMEGRRQGMLLRVLAAVGGGDLALGRLYEGHVNGLLMVMRYGTHRQIERFAEDCRAGMLSGVWNTGGRDVLRLHPEEGGVFRFEGGKTFATGAAFVRRPIVTGDVPGRGWQMTLPRMETLDVKIDRSFLAPDGNGVFGELWDRLYRRAGGGGGPNWWAGGFLSRSAVSGRGGFGLRRCRLGRCCGCMCCLRSGCTGCGGGDDPYQVARLGEVAILAQQAALWVEKAGSVAEVCLFREEKEWAERMVECANMTRIAIERIATRAMQLVTEGVGAHGLLQPARFERVVRDLTMYLRQPAPDQTLADVGRASMRKCERVKDCAGNGFWGNVDKGSSLPPEYFRKIYERNADPWGFQTSSYEAGKYLATIESLPRERYQRAVEVGCSIGVLTEMLAERCEWLLGLDVSERALGQARERLAEAENVEFRLDAGSTGDAGWEVRPDRDFGSGLLLANGGPGAGSGQDGDDAGRWRTPFTGALDPTGERLSADWGCGARLLD